VVDRNIWVAGGVEVEGVGWNWVWLRRGVAIGKAE
jgi:hypothetical protein